jgi:hypothetical protein
MSKDEPAKAAGALLKWALPGDGNQKLRTAFWLGVGGAINLTKD